MSVPPYLRPPVGVTSAHVDTAAGRLALLEAGRPGTQRTGVVLVPGFTGSKEDFIAVLGAIAADGRHVVAYDQRGQYESVGPEEDSAYTVDALAADVLAVVAWMGGAPVHLLGHSFGGLVARRAVLNAPQCFRSLVLLGSGPAAIPGQRSVWLRRLRSVLRQGGVPAVWAATKALSAGDPRAAAQPPEMQEFLERRFLASSAAGMKVMGETLLTEPDTVEELRRSGVPILVAHGEDDDAWPGAVQAEMARRLGARYVAVPDAVHSPAAEAPEATADTLLAFWRAVDAGTATG